MCALPPQPNVSLSQTPMDRFAERRKAFKAAGTSQWASQETRRAQALEEQKRKRLQHIDSSRQLDQFADLKLDASDDELDEDDTGRQTPMSGVGQYSNILHVEDAEPPPESRTPSPLPEHLQSQSNKPGKSRRKRKKGKAKKQPGPWANKCMYAELLEMREDASWDGTWDSPGVSQNDGLPNDLDSAWVGLAPVPVGKRCLAVTMQSAGVSGIVPNTILRSRLLGKVIIHPFPSPLPPNTILDCILDENWRKNGILHVLDVIRWKSQDLGSCEATFRFWWRDTRISEMPAWPPPAPHKSSFSSDLPTPEYRYTYPTTLVSVPCCAPLSYDQILGDLIQRARLGRTQHARIPILSLQNANNIGSALEADGDAEMEVDNESHGLWSAARIDELEVSIMSDGLLLYVGEAAYDPGVSPLSVWVPRKCPEEVKEERGHVRAQAIGSSAEPPGTNESPLDWFERLIRRRLGKQMQQAVEGDMET